MTKRIISIFLVLVLICAPISYSASATISQTDVKVADIKLYADKTDVNVGDTLTVTIYVENITAKNGIMAVDAPLSFDKEKLEFVKLECIFPDAWGIYGEFFGHPTPDEDPWYLRSLPDASDLIENYTKYSVKDSKELGYKITFKAVAEGVASISVKDVGSKTIMFVAYEDEQVVNYGGNGDSINISIGSEEFNAEKGDVNGDGYVDNTDALTVLKYDAGITDLTDSELGIADVNGDGYADNTDALMILKYDAGITDQL